MGIFAPSHDRRNPVNSRTNNISLTSCLPTAMIFCIMADKGTKIIDAFHKISDKRGNGALRREVWADKDGRITRYNLAYINFFLFTDDNGRVVGYDNAHGYHHRHWFGRVEAVEFTSFEDLEERFQRDWSLLRAAALASLSGGTS